MTKDSAHLVFVYGCSRKGHSLSCEEFGKFVSNAVVKGYWLYELSILGRSYAVPSRADRPQPTPLSGEVYELDEPGIQKMDALHEVSSGLYERAKIDVCIENGEVVSAWIYEGVKIAPTRIESGDWAHRGVDCGKA